MDYNNNISVFFGLHMGASIGEFFLFAYGASNGEKSVELCLRWFGHVRKRLIEPPVRKS